MQFSFPSVYMPVPSTEVEKTQTMNQRHLQVPKRAHGEVEKRQSMKKPYININAQAMRTAQSCMEQGDDSHALMLIEEVLGREPYHPEALRRKTNILQKTGNLSGALNCLDHIIECYSDQCEPYFRRGAILLQQHQHIEAMKDFNMGFALRRPKSAHSSSEFFMFLSSMTSFNAVKETALFYIEQSIRLHPAYQEDLLMLRALFYATQGDFDSALSDIEIVCRNPHKQLAAALRMLFWERAAKEPGIPNPQTIPHLQRGRVPIAVLLNEKS